jgi:hypothetical protein
MLDFNDELHQYTFNGVVKPSVTQCLSKLHDFGLVRKDILEAACQRGSFVHTLCEYHDENDLDSASIGIYAGYLDAWIAFCADYKAVWEGIEVRGYSERYGYAGTWDRHGLLNGAKFVCDIKTSQASHPVWGLQTAAYRQLKAETDSSWMLARRATVQLRPDGTYKFIEWTDPTDWTTFLSLINLINWSQKS